MWLFFFLNLITLFQVNKLVLAHLSADRVPIASSGVRYFEKCLSSINLFIWKTCPGLPDSFLPTVSPLPFHSHRFFERLSQPELIILQSNNSLQDIVGPFAKAMNHSSNDVKVTSPNQLFTQYYVTRCLWRWWSRTWPSPPTQCCPTSFWSQCSPAWSTEPWRKTLWWRVAGLYLKILPKAKETK